MDWSRERPKANGWHFWRRSKTVKDEMKWKVYYVKDGTLFECGGSVKWPSGGWWVPACTKCSKIGESIM